MQTLPFKLSARATDLRSSPIRDILAVIERPGMISFAGGLPAAESFPQLSLAGMPQSNLQYGASEGEPELRRQIAEELQSLGLDCAPEQVLILSGSQQGVDLVAKLFIDPGTCVAVESPTYLAALQVFRFFGASFEPIGTVGTPRKRPAFAYAIPTFQNPTGRCYNERERHDLAAWCDDEEIVLFEDDPYRDLVYTDCVRTPVCSLLSRADWIYQGSFSKSLAPGLRLGFMAAAPSLLPYLTRLKQAADLHSNRISQWLVLQQLRRDDHSERLARLAEIYRAKRDAFAQGLARHFTDLATWQLPPGGLFFWLELKERIDTRTLLPAAIERNVAFMPGEPFFADDRGPRGCLRLNFSHAQPSQIDSGLEILAEVIASAASRP